MTYDQARDVMLAIFRDAWLLAGNTDAQITYSDVPAATSTSEQVWARVTVRHATGRNSSLTGGLGTKRYTNRGTLWVQVFAPMGDGSTEGYDASQAVVNAYRDAQTQVLFRNVRMQEAGKDGAFQRFDVKADFEYDDVR